MQMLHFPCLPSYLFLLRLGVTLLYCLPFHWILYPLFIACLFCTESIRVRRRDLSNILFEEIYSTIVQKFANLKNSFFGQDDSISKDANTSSLSINTFPTSCCQGFSSLAGSSFNNSLSSSSSSFVKSPWSSSLEATSINDPSSSSVFEETNACNELIASLVRKEGHVYSMAISGDLLYTGSDSKNICVWDKHTEISGFKSRGGLVKTIVIAGGKIFTGHRDGLIRVWKCSSRNPRYHKRIGTLPTFKDHLKNVIKPIGYFDGNGCHRDVWVKHLDAISCLSFNEDKTLLYSASWDKTFKVWRVSDWKCLESIQAHDDAVNSIVAGCNGLVFTGSADGTVKVWRRDIGDKVTRHLLLQTLLNQDCAITALAVNRDAAFVYCGSSDGLVNFWEFGDSLSYGGSLRGHSLAVLCLVTAGNLVISGSGDKTISVWKRCGNQHFFLSKLTEHHGPIKCLAIEKDCDESTTSSGENQWILYSGSLDKSVKIWRVSDQTPSRQNPSETDSSDTKCTSSSIEIALENDN